MTSTPSSTPSRRARPRKPAVVSITPPAPTRETDLGTVTPLNGDFLYVEKETGEVRRILHSATPGNYELRDTQDFILGTLTEAGARKLFEGQWDIYQRVLT